MPMNRHLPTEFNHINEFAAIAYHACCTCAHGAGRWARWTVMVALGRARGGTAWRIYKVPCTNDMLHFNKNIDRVDFRERQLS